MTYRDFLRKGQGDIHRLKRKGWDDAHQLSRSNASRDSQILGCQGGDTLRTVIENKQKTQNWEEKSRGKKMGPSEGKRSYIEGSKDSSSRGEGLFLISRTGGRVWRTSQRGKINKKGRVRKSTRKKLM